MDPIAEQIIMLMKQVGKFAHSRIPRKGDKDAYVYGLKACISLASQDVINIDALKRNIEISRVMAYDFKRKLFMTARPQEYYEMAHDHALDAVNSVNDRFVAGFTNSAPQMYGDRGTPISSEEDIFGTE